MNENIRAALQDVFKQINALSPAAFAEKLNAYENSEFAISLMRLFSFAMRTYVIGSLQITQSDFSCAPDIEYSIKESDVTAVNDDYFMLAA